LLLIKELNQCEKLDRIDDELILTFIEETSTDEVKQNIIETLFLNKIDIREITKSKTTIEDIFIKLVSSDNEKVVI
jgi:hypothetical protein